MYKGTIIVEKNESCYCAYPQEYGKRLAVVAETHLEARQAAEKAITEFLEMHEGVSPPDSICN